MGTKSCTKIINFSTRFSCDDLAVEDFVTLPIGEKILLMGKCFVWERFRQYVYALLPVLYAGEIQNSNCRRLEIATYFFL